MNGPNPREANNFGQIVRWYPREDDHAATTFDWDLYVMAGNPVTQEGAYKGSPNVNEGNMFNSPDGMVFDSSGLVWIQTDGSYSVHVGTVVCSLAEEGDPSRPSLVKSLDCRYYTTVAWSELCMGFG